MALHYDVVLLIPRRAVELSPPWPCPSLRYLIESDASSLVSKMILKELSFLYQSMASDWLIFSALSFRACSLDLNPSYISTSRLTFSVDIRSFKNRQSGSEKILDGGVWEACNKITMGLLSPDWIAALRSACVLTLCVCGGVFYFKV